jgi:hypothetical protein
MRPALFAAAAALIGLAACSDPRQEFIRELSLRTGLPEEALIAQMGRAPDSSSQVNTNTRILTWRWNSSYLSPGKAPTWVDVRGEQRPVGSTPPRRIVRNCVVEWRVVDGVASTFTTHGDGCTGS